MGFSSLSWGLSCFLARTLLIEGRSYVEALVAETVRSLDYIQANRRGTMMGTPHHLKMWLFEHIQPFCSYHLFLNLVDAHLFETNNRRHEFDWRKFMQQLTPEQISWSTPWNPDGPMAIGCPTITGLPLISHLGTFIQMQIALLTRLLGLTPHHHPQGGSYELAGLDGCGILASHRTFTSRSAPPTKNERTVPLQHTWPFSTCKTLGLKHLFWDTPL
ncbi:hypothetical protein CRG98_012350 [Punica granatum]|uniref:DUF7745 domain-containing protein n=1 Tax=Punica granatum TaxID=22663 RepID=A0A2I0KFJ8_PUNGR|nr:hypothetical protein CRG98_012350 [Punica granatum]